MKKLSKLALLAAAATLMLAGMAGCFTSVSDDDDTQQTTGGSTGTGGSGSTGTTGDSVTVDAAWDFDKGEKASEVDAIKQLSDDGEILASNIAMPADSGSGATLILLANGPKIKYGSNTSKSGTHNGGGGIQLGAGGSEKDFAELKVDGACTVTIVAAGASGSSHATNINSFSINGENQFKVALSEKQDTAKHTYTYTASEAETIKITATGMKFLSIVCSQ